MGRVSYIAAEDGIDTARLQTDHPELFDVTEKHGVERWKLRADVRAVLRGPLDRAGGKWMAARDRFFATGDDADKAAVMAAALEYRAALLALELMVEPGDRSDWQRAAG